MENDYFEDVPVEVSDRDRYGKVEIKSYYDFYKSILFVPNKIPELLKYLQQGKEAFKKGVSDTNDLNIKDNVN